MNGDILTENVLKHTANDMLLSFNWSRAFAHTMSLCGGQYFLDIVIHCPGSLGAEPSDQAFL